MSTELLRGRYEPLAVAGRGGQGEVLRARDHQHNRDVALKVRNVVADKESLLSEARVLLGLTPHAGLPLVRDDFFADDGRYVIVMDWIEGRSLDDVLSSEGAPGLDLARVLEWLGRVAAALDHLHSHSPPVVHGDVKPANVILTSDGRVVLVDFGIASARGPVGTPGFMAPELLAGMAPTPAADVYGLAATTFVLLNGEKPELGVRPSWPGLSRKDAKRVEQVLVAGLALDVERRPPSATELVARLRPREGPTNLPAALTSFVGRREPLGEVRRLVRKERLVTLTGPGGVGKTRLCYEAASGLRRDFPDGVWVAELASLADPALVPQHTAVACGVRETADAEEALAAALRDATALVVLDNCEHVLDACGALVLRLLRHCPRVRVLCSSRQALGAEGEVVWGVPALDASSEAVKLFRDRAARVRREFKGSAEAIAHICRNLEGIPLAIELAAARVASLSADEIAARLDDRLRLLEGGARTTYHHRTLRAAIDWSYDMLDAPARELFERLSVFAGTFTLEAVEACFDDAWELAGLVDRSLVQVAAQHDGETRYRLLDTLRQYAAERLGKSDAYVRHRSYYLRHAELRDAARLERDLDNFRVALGSLLDDEPASALDLVLLLTDLWTVRGYVTEGRRWVWQALESYAIPDERRGKGLSVGGVLAWHQGDWTAAESSHGAALAIWRELGNRAGIARALNNLGAISDLRGDLERAEARFAESLAIRIELDDRPGEAEALSNLGHTATSKGDLGRARELFERSLEIDRALGNRRGVADALSNLGTLAGRAAELEKADAFFSEAMTIRRELGDRRGIAESLSNAGLVAQLRGNLTAARALYEESLEIDRELGNRPGMEETLRTLEALQEVDGAASKTEA